MRALFLVVFLLAGFSCFAQQFPKDFIGHWEGELHWFQPQKPEPQKIKMQLRIQPADTAGQYSWQLIYGEEGKDNRPYILKPVDTAKGHWKVDENNGIILDQYWLGNRVICAFTVQTTTIVNSYTLENGMLTAEFYSLTASAVNTTGGSNNIPQVTSYGAKGFQKALLKRKAP